MKFVTLFALLLVCLTVSAQSGKDYYITPSGDTIFGTIDRVKSRYMKFTEDGTATTRKLNSNGFLKAYKYVQQKTYLPAFEVRIKTRELPKIFESKSSGPIYLIHETATVTTGGLSGQFGAWGTTSSNVTFLLKDGQKIVTPFDNNWLFGGTKKERIDKLKQLFEDDSQSLAILASDDDQRIPIDKLMQMIEEYNQRKQRK